MFNIWSPPSSFDYNNAERNQVKAVFAQNVYFNTTLALTQNKMLLLTKQTKEKLPKQFQRQRVGKPNKTLFIHNIFIDYEASVVS